MHLNPNIIKGANSCNPIFISLYKFLALLDLKHEYDIKNMQMIFTWQKHSI